MHSSFAAKTFSSKCIQHIVLITFLMLGLQSCHEDNHDTFDSSNKNIAPAVSDVTIIPPTQPGQPISASYTYIDEHDPEGASTYQWLIDGELIAETLTTTLPADSEGKRLTFCITPVASSGDIKNGDEVCVETDIIGEYSKPTLDSLLVTSPLTTGIDVTATYNFVDENNRAEGESTFLWQIDGVDLSTELSINLPPESEGKILTICITPIAVNGENAQGDQVCSEELTIGAKAGAAAAIENLTLVGFAKTNNSLSFTYDFVDADGDAEATSLISWFIDGTEVGQTPSLTLPSDSNGKRLSLCITPVSATGTPTQGEQYCIEKDIADIVIAGELTIEKTITLDIKGYTYNSVAWRILDPSYNAVRSNSDTSFTITGLTETESATFIVANDIEVCIDTIEEGELCFSVADQPTSLVTGGMPIEIDENNNITKRVISPVNYIDLTISGITKRLHRPLNVTESILLNANENVPLHTSVYQSNSPGIDWALFDQATATSSCAARGMVLPVQGYDDTSDPFGLQQFDTKIRATYPQFSSSPVTRAMGWPDQYFRSSSFRAAGSHYDFYLVTNSPDYIDDSESEGVACLSTVP